MTLSWKSFTTAADRAGLFRWYGGSYLKDGDLAVLEGGRPGDATEPARQRPQAVR